MSKTDKSNLKALLSEQLIQAFEVATEAEQNEDVELQELTIHYMFDLLDWGRRNLQLSDNELLSPIDKIKNNEDVFSISIKQLENSIEDKLLENTH